MEAASPDWLDLSENQKKSNQNNLLSLNSSRVALATPPQYPVSCPAMPEPHDNRYLPASAGF
jgi:hypothetical protein